MSAVRWRHYVVSHWSDPLYRQSYLMLTSTGVSAATGLLFWVLAAHRAQPAALGVAAGMVAALAFLSYLTSFALPYAMLRFGGAATDLSSLTNAFLVFSALTSMLAAAVFAVVAPSVSPGLARLLSHPADVVVFGLAGAGAAASVLVDNLLAARRKAGVVLARNTATGLLRLALLAVTGHGDPRALYLAATLPALVTVLAVVGGLPWIVPGYRLLRCHLGPDVRTAASFAARNVPGSLLSGAPQFALPVIAVLALSARDYAFFYVAWSIAQMVHLVPTVISNITLSQVGSAPVGELVSKTRRFCALLLVPCCVVGVALGGVVLSFYGADYVGGAGLPLRLLVVAALPWTVVIVAQTQLRIEHRFRSVTVLTGAFCVASLGLPLAFAPAWGISGMAAGWLAAVVAAAVLAHGLTGAWAAGGTVPAGAAADQEWRGARG